MIAQAAAIGGLTWVFMGRAEPNPPPLTPAAAFVGLLMAIILVAFATAIITRLWDRAVLAIAGGRTSMRQSEQASRKELGVGRPVPRAEESTQVGQRRRIG